MITSSFSRLAIGAGLVCMAVSGCTTTPKGWRKKEPLIDTVSAKSADEVIRCVSDLWQSQGAVPSYLPRANGGTLSLILAGVFGPSGQVGWMLDVDKADHGSVVRFYGIKSIWSKANAKTNAEIISCI